ncbi:hypothetical protein NKOR_08285 [Candidatus Nitrosopumilus koreensis AR1]|uniref:Uncharacterized protein n=1 Tax=Candidatus Nitrosopumilus koreensis AR1 TaxID=1229908 RepID=K0BAQ2_9ARCH|nr:MULTISPECIES: hypothetical protein [Nitrosopumilus]AFS81516.1 hypothetical protein NKOR_08285 [Candidatus Nitrosopumilus koreensis AR1]
MTDPLLDDVKALLEKDFGDDRILKQIRRACENNEVISNFERNYVKKLSEKHLGRKPETPTSAEKPVVPDVVLPETPSVQKIQTIQSPPKTTSASSKNSKLMLGVGGIALVVIIAAAVYFGGISDMTPNVVDTPTENESLTIQTDFPSYNNKDIISISGVSDTIGSVNLSIENQNGKLVWAEQLSLKSNGQYSTLAIAGGPGWENSGTYTIKVDNGAETKSRTFSFTA